MPYLQRRAVDPDDHWIVFENGYVNTPLCCPSRATMLTGRFSHHTGVRNNEDGSCSTRPRRSRPGCTTRGTTRGWSASTSTCIRSRAAVRPAGWDRWWGRSRARRRACTTTTRCSSGHVVRTGTRRRLRDRRPGRPGDRVVREAPVDRPCFLWFTPTAPHPPWVAAPRDEGRSRSSRCRRRLPRARPTSPTGRPGPRPRPDGRRAASDPAPDRRQSYAALLAIDDATDDHGSGARPAGSGDGRGLHLRQRSRLRRAPVDQEELSVRGLPRRPLPLSGCRTPRIAPNARSSRGRPRPDDRRAHGCLGSVGLDGVSLVPLLSTGGRAGLPGEVFAEWVGDKAIPAWWEVRTGGCLDRARHRRTRALRAAGRPYELVNVVDAPAFQADVSGSPRCSRRTGACEARRRGRSWGDPFVAPVAAGVPASAANAGPSAA